MTQGIPGHDKWKTQEPPEGPDLEKAHERAETALFRSQMDRLLKHMKDLQDEYMSRIRITFGEDGDCLEHDDCCHEALDAAIRVIARYLKEKKVDDTTTHGGG